MTADQSIRTLVVANRTASTPAMLDEVRRRSGAGARFDLMVPPERGDLHDWTPDEAKQMLEEAWHGDVECIEAGDDAGATIRRLVDEARYDYILVSTAPEHHVRWLHHDLPKRIQELPVQVTVIPPEPHSWKPIEGFPPEWGPHPVGGPGAY